MKDYQPFFFTLLINLLRYLILAGIPFLLFYLIFPKRFLKNKIQTQFAKKKDFFREISYSMSTIFLIAGMIAFFMHSSLNVYTQVYTNISDFPIWWIPLSILCVLLLHDTYFYWMHRIIHHPQLFKSIHLVHHKSINPSPWASYAFHVLEGFLEILVIPFILILIPLHPLSLIVVGFIAFSMNVYGHLGYEIAPKWFRHSPLFNILNTSTYHNLHHSTFDGNYGLYFRFWDQLMKTEHPDYVKLYDQIQAKRFHTNPQEL